MSALDSISLSEASSGRVDLRRADAAFIKQIYRDIINDTMPPEIPNPTEVLWVRIDKEAPWQPAYVTDRVPGGVSRAPNTKDKVVLVSLIGSRSYHWCATENTCSYQEGLEMHYSENIELPGGKEVLAEANGWSKLRISCRETPLPSIPPIVGPVQDGERLACIRSLDGIKLSRDEVLGKPPVESLTHLLRHIQNNFGPHGLSTVNEPVLAEIAFFMSHYCNVTSKIPSWNPTDTIHETWLGFFQKLLKSFESMTSVPQKRRRKSMATCQEFTTANDDVEIEQTGADKPPDAKKQRRDNHKKNETSGEPRSRQSVASATDIAEITDDLVNDDAAAAAALLAASSSASAGDDADNAAIHDNGKDAAGTDDVNSHDTNDQEKTMEVANDADGGEDQDMEGGDIANEDMGVDVDKVLGVRQRRRAGGADGLRDEDADHAEGDSDKVALVKWKGQAYIHAEWVDYELLTVGRWGLAKVQRYEEHVRATGERFGALAGQNESERAEASVSNFAIEDASDDWFDPQYTQVDRIIQERIEDGELEYLVKWRGLDYREASWELPETFQNNEKIQEYEDNVKRLGSQPPTCPKPKWSAYTPNRPSTIPVFPNGLKLMNYQIAGLRWLVRCWYEGRGSMLADEMGLGKTIQATAFLNHLRTNEKCTNPFLVVSPLSTLGHWKREIETWTNFSVIQYSGPSEARSLIRTYDWTLPRNRSKQVGGAKTRYRWDVLITTFDTLRNDFAHIGRIDWQVMVVDEAQNAKNPSSKIYECLQSVKARHTLLMTGTPLQNNTTELWSLLSLLDRQQKWLLPADEFERQFGNITSEKDIKKLRRVVNPFMLRRVKKDVLKGVPPKEETLVTVQLTATQKKYYKAILEKNRSFLTGGKAKTQMPKLNNLFIALRHCCNHPYLLTDGIEPTTQGDDRQPIADGEAQASVAEGRGSSKSTKDAAPSSSTDADAQSAKDVPLTTPGSPLVSHLTLKKEKAASKDSTAVSGDGKDNDGGGALPGDENAPVASAGTTVASTSSGGTGGTGNDEAATSVNGTQSSANVKDATGEEDGLAKKVKVELKSEDQNPFVTKSSTVEVKQEDNAISDAKACHVQTQAGTYGGSSDGGKIVEKQPSTTYSAAGHIDDVKGTSSETVTEAVTDGKETVAMVDQPSSSKKANTRELKAYTRELKPDSYIDRMVKASGKMLLLHKLLGKLYAGDHKVLIFSGFKKVLHLISDYLVHMDYLHECVTGDVTSNERQKAIDRFMNPKMNRFVFLLTTRAGGVGINLTAADTVIIFDSDWNPQSDIQAQSRCHRIGQTKSVKVFRLITKNSYEEAMFDKASQKLGLARVLLGKGKENASAKQKAEVIERMLKLGAYEVLKNKPGEDGIDEDASKFNEEDIDQILQSNSRVIRYNDEFDDSTENSTVGRATFAIDEDGKDVSVDDPDFWKKMLKELDPLQRLQQMLAAKSAEIATVDFMNELSQLVEEHVVAVLAGEEVLKEQAPLLDLLEDVIGDDRFTIEQKQVVEQLTQELHRPTRKRKSVIVVDTASTHGKDVFDDVTDEWVSEAELKQRKKQRVEVRKRKKEEDKLERQRERERKKIEKVQAKEESKRKKQAEKELKVKLKKEMQEQQRMLREKQKAATRERIQKEKAEAQQRKELKAQKQRELKLQKEQQMQLMREISQRGVTNNSSKEMQQRRPQIQLKNRAGSSLPQVAGQQHHNQQPRNQNPMLTLAHQQAGFVDQQRQTDGKQFQHDYQQQQLEVQQQQQSKQWRQQQQQPQQSVIIPDFRNLSSPSSLAQLHAKQMAMLQQRNDQTVMGGARSNIVGLSSNVTSSIPQQASSSIDAKLRFAPMTSPPPLRGVVGHHSVQQGTSNDRSAPMGSIPPMLASIPPRNMNRGEPTSKSSAASGMDSKPPLLPSTLKAAAAPPTSMSPPQHTKSPSQATAGTVQLSSFLSTLQPPPTTSANTECRFTAASTMKRDDASKDTRSVGIPPRATFSPAVGSDSGSVVSGMNFSAQLQGKLQNSLFSQSLQMPKLPLPPPPSSKPSITRDDPLPSDVPRHHPAATPSRHPRASIDSSPKLPQANPWSCELCKSVVKRSAKGWRHDVSLHVVQQWDLGHPQHSSVPEVIAYIRRLGVDFFIQTLNVAAS